LSPTQFWFNHRIVGLPAKEAGFVPVADGKVGSQEMRPPS
jgi:hypothetical protein